MSDIKRIAGTPDDEDMVRPFGIVYHPVDSPQNGYEVETVVLTVPDTKHDGTVRFVRVVYGLDAFYNLREAVNDLYNHIRQEQSTD